jgi:FkbM family methyltransferase
VKTALRRGIIAVLRSMLRLSGARGRYLVGQALAGDTEAVPSTDAQAIPFSREVISTPRGAITFHCLGELALWRARTLSTKEPETLEWIDSFGDGDVYWDIGANVGVYALYAAINRRIRVLAFEPSAANYFLLNRNIEINGLADWLQAYCLAFSDGTRIDTLNMQNTELGGALSSFGSTVDESGRTFVPKFRQGSIGYSVDQFVERFAPPFPNHVKIDVDGIEDRIVAGAAATLRDPRLRSLSIELDEERPDYTRSVIASIEQAGLRLAAKRHSQMVAQGGYKNIFNYQFHRASSQRAFP